MQGFEQEKIHEKPFNGRIRLVIEEDIPQLKPILETWVRNRKSSEVLTDEIDNVLQEVQNSIVGKNKRVYLVAEGQDGNIVGMIGLQNPESIMKSFAKTHNPVELINAYVAKEHRGGKGVGTALVKNIEEEAKQRGYTEVILNSGPRYKDTGWGFYDKLPEYKRVGVAEKMYGDDGNAPIWSKILSKK